MHDDELRLLVNQVEKRSTVAEVLGQAALFKRVHVDIGAGDGKFLYHLAKLHPENFHIAIDANGEGMKEVSRKVERKPAKGGLPARNLLFIISSLESIPRSFAGFADHMTINYPWGSLLSGLLVPDEGILGKVAQLAKNSCSIIILLNYSIFDDRDYIQRLRLPLLDASFVENTLKPAYRRFGMEIHSHGETETDLSTGWKNRLTQAKRDKTYALRIVKD